MKNTYTVTQAQAKLPSLVRSVQEEGGVYGISVHNQTSAYLVSRERMESLLETLEILGSAAAVTAISEHRSGKTKFHDLSQLED